MVKLFVQISFLIIFNLFFFVFCNLDASNASRWISYGMITFGYLFVMFGTSLTLRENNDNAAHDYTQYFIGVTYLALELIVGIIFIIANPEGYVAALFIQSLLFIIYLIVFAIYHLLNHHTNVALEKQNAQSAVLRDMSNKVSMIGETIKDSSLKKLFDQTANMLKNSPLETRPDVRQFESEINELIGFMTNDPSLNDRNPDDIKNKLEKIQILIKQRNNQLKMKR